MLTRHRGVHALAAISRSALCCHSNETRAPTLTAIPFNIQLRGILTILPSYVRVRGVVWECGEGQTDRQTHTHTHTHTEMRVV